MALTESLRFLVDSNSAAAQADLKRLGLTASDSMSKLEKLKSAAGTGIGIGAGVGAVEGVIQGLQRLGTFAISQFNSAVGAASNLEQSAGAVKAIFREAAGQVSDFGKEAATSVGLSAAAYQQQAATLGALLQNLGQTRQQSAETSQALVQVGADLAATFGGKTSDAVNAIGSALRGERDPIERYGISIKQAGVDAKVLALGLDTSTESLKAQAQATATLALIQQQASSSSGAFARESDTLAGQQQRLQAELENARAEIGQQLLPVMVELTKVARDIIPYIEGTAAAFGIAADAAADAAGFVGQFSSVLAGIPGVRELAAINDALFGSTGQDNVRATLDAADAYAQMFEAVRAGKQPLDDLLPGLAFLPPVFREIAAELFQVAAAQDTASVSTDDLAKQIAALSKESSGLLNSLIGADKGQSAFFKSLSTGSGGAAKSAGTVERAYRRIEDAQRGVVDAQADLNEALISRFLVGLGPTTDDITLGQIAERESTRDLADAKRDLADAQDRLNKARDTDQATLLDAEAAYIQAQRDFVDAEKAGDVVQVNRAKADLLRTEKALGDARSGSTVDDIALAEQDLAAAQDKVAAAEIASKRSRQELNDLINSGKEGSKQLAEANKAVEAAQRRVVDSEQAVIDAQDALNTSTTNLAGSTKSANEQFQIGITAADGWLQKLIDGKATPDEFSAAVKTIYDNLKDVADQAGETSTLDTYLTKVSNIYAQLKNISGFGNFAPGGFSNDPANAFQSMPETKVVMNLDGRSFGEAIVTGLLAYQSANGSIPIKVR